jgi:hypothetical protein
MGDTEVWNVDQNGNIYSSAYDYLSQIKIYGPGSSSTFRLNVKAEKAIRYLERFSKLSPEFKGEVYFLDTDPLACQGLRQYGRPDQFVRAREQVRAKSSLLFVAKFLI